MMKKISLILCVCLLGVGLTSCNTTNKKKDEFVLEYSYYENIENIPLSWDWFDYDDFMFYLSQKLYVKSDFQEIKKLIESNKKFMVYYGFNPAFYQCPYCVASLPSAVMAAQELNIVIYYLDVYQMRMDNTDEYLYLYNGLLNQFPDFGTRISVPTYVTYENSKPLGYHVATLRDSENNYLKAMIASQREELKQKYIQLYNGEIE